MGVPVLSVGRALAALSTLLALGLGGLAAAGAAEPTAAEATGPAVRRIVVRSEIPVDGAEIANLVAVEPGAPLTDEQVRRTLRSLRVAGLAAEVELHTVAVADGIDVVLVLRPDLRVDSVELEGETGIDAERLIAEVPQRPGRPLREDRLLRGAYALKERLEAEGYLGATVHLAVDVDRATHRARVVYRIVAGPRTRVGRVSIEGLPAVLAETDAIEAMRARPGEALRRTWLRDDSDRLQRFLVRSGFRTASVDAVVESPLAGTDRVDLLWRVRAGPEVELELSRAERKLLEKRGLLPFLGDAGYDDALLNQAIGQIRAYYQRRGHYRVAVRATEERTEDRLLIRLAIEPGARSTLEEVEFEGNEAVADERLARLVQTTPRRLITPGSGRLVDEVLAEDLSNLRSFYALAGYDRARIGPARVESLPDDGLRLVVPVVEGVKRSVVAVRIEGLAALDPERVVRDLPLTAGGPYHRLLVESAAERIRSRLEEIGHRSAIVAPDVRWNSDSTVAEVLFRVLEGDRSTADAVLVRGNTRTRSGVLRGFLGIAAGDPISTSSLLDVQRRLYRLGVFSRVDVSATPAGAEPAAHEVLVEVEEGKTRSAAYGAGYDSEAGARGLLRLSESNLYGRLITVQLDALVAERDQHYRLLARQPYLGRWPIETRALIYREAEDRPSFDVRRRGAQLGLSRNYGELTAGLYYDYRLVELDTDQPIEVVPRESREARVASLTPTFLWDHRDDPLDPTRGWSASFLVERAFPAFAADADFARLFGQATSYLPSRKAGVVAISVRAGVLEPYAEAEDPALEPFDAVPSAERFYAGGRTSHRAFSRDELGVPGETLFVEPDGDVVALGGGALALLNLEWRFPIAGDFGGVAFVDGGNVWRQPGDFDADELRWGAGVGLRYRSPIGPLRVEIGWKLDRLPFEDPYELFFSLGNPF